MATPLWDVLILPEYKSKEDEEVKSVFGFRIHHAIGDGYSMLQFLSRVFDPSSLEKNLVPSSKPAATISLNAHLATLFWTPFSTFKFFRAFYLHSDYFTVPKVQRGQTLSRTSIPLKHLKEARLNMSLKLHNSSVSFLALILHLVGSGLRKYLVEDVKLVVLPKKVYMIASIPKPGSLHPEGTFCNHW
jgi:hypothetical protein